MMAQRGDETQTAMVGPMTKQLIQPGQGYVDGFDVSELARVDS